MRGKGERKGERQEGMESHDDKGNRRGEAKVEIKWGRREDKRSECKESAERAELTEKRDENDNLYRRQD